ncbi:MAG: LysR family transcriptional regulator [Bacillus sp. (in: firmicutes)]
MYDYSGLSFQHIQCFIMIAEQGTMNKAAEVLHVSPSLLSQKISQMENLIGIQLFRRSRQRLYLTDAGNQLLVDLKGIQSHLNFVLDSAREQYCTRHALTIGFTNYQGSNSVNVILSEFRKVYPNLDFTVEILPRGRLQEDFLDGKINIVCTTDVYKLHHNKAIRSRTAFMIPMGCYVSASSPIARKNQLTWKDLNGATCILPEHVKDSSFVLDLKRKFNKENVVVSIEYHTGDIMTIHQLVAVKNCITFAGYQWIGRNELKCFTMSNLDYPYLVAWYTDASKDISTFAETLYDIICKNRSVYELPSRQIL